MTKLYKLTDEQGRTRAGEDNELTWAVGVEHRTAGMGTRLCTADVIHAYEHPLIAVLMNPVHADFDPARMRLFVAEGNIVAREGQLKCGVHALKIVEEIHVPVLTTEQRAKFAILCAKQVCKNATWNAWADKWLSDEDRTARAAEAAWATARAARAATTARAAEAAWTAAAEAAAAAWAAAEAAAWAAEAATTARAARAAQATAVAAAAAEAREAAREADLIQIVEQL